MRTTLIKNAIVVNRGTSFRGSLLIKDDLIEALLPGDCPAALQADEVIEAEGRYLLPGVIDDHVHFRDPGLTDKADMASESRAAAAGGVTSIMDMPNTKPQTVTIEALEAKFAHAADSCRVNHSFYFGATNDNLPLLARLDPRRVCGIKVFMGSSTGNMLVDDDSVLRSLFAQAQLPIAVHCEDSALIAANVQKYTHGGEKSDLPVQMHPLIRSAQACYRSTERAVRLARETGARLHVMHISTARELQLFDTLPLGQKRITAEATVSHLLYTDADYDRLGTRIKCNPAIKSEADRAALWEALRSGLVDLVGTDHAPHRLCDKEGGALKAASGIPMIQFSLPLMLQSASEGRITIERVAECMSHAPARIFGIERRGFLDAGCYADMVLAAPCAPCTVTAGQVLSKCGWSPLEGSTLQWQIERTWVNGHTVWNNGQIDDSYRGRPLTFSR